MKLCDGCDGRGFLENLSPCPACNPMRPTAEHRLAALEAEHAEVLRRLHLAELSLVAQGSAIARLERAVANLECMQHGRLVCYADVRGAAALHDIRENVAAADDDAD